MWKRKCFYITDTKSILLWKGKSRSDWFSLVLQPLCSIIDHLKVHNNILELKEVRVLGPEGHISGEEASSSCDEEESLGLPLRP